VRKRGLGRGLSELISGDALAQSRSVIEVRLAEIEPNPYQPRKHMDDDSIEDLARSIERHGVVQPILVRRSGDGYQLIAGERRWRAARRAGLATIPCMVDDVNDEGALELALIENLQRDDLSGIEAALGYRRLMEEFGLTQEQVAEYVGKSRSAIANTLRLLDLPEDIRGSIQEGRISEGHGRALLGLASNPAAMTEAWQRVSEEGLSVRDTERLVREALSPAREAPAVAQPAAAAPIDPNLAEVQTRLQSALAAKVTIKPRGKRGGTIEIKFSNGEDLDRLVETLAPADGLLG
jgi:ParB family transcriptional regulator, chromosome partitioning protein